MADYFQRALAWDPVGGLLPGAVAAVYAASDTARSNPLAITDRHGVPLANLIADAYGVYPEFEVTAGETDVVAVSGSYETSITSVAGLKGEPGLSVTSAEVSGGELIFTMSDSSTINAGPIEVIDGGGSGISGAPSVWPTTFPPSGHSHPATQILDSSSVGRAVLTAADAQAARAAIGAGTGNGTSNLTLGSAGTQAMPGNRVFNADELAFTPTVGSPVTATTVKAAIEQAAATGTGGGATNVYVWRYASGAYPTLPASKPAGIEVVQAYGPVAPTTVPSWVGTGSGQALGRYEYAALT